MSWAIREIFCILWEAFNGLVFLINYYEIEIFLYFSSFDDCPLLQKLTLPCLIVGGGVIFHFFDFFIYPQNQFIMTLPPFYDFSPKKGKNLHFLGGFK